MGGRFKREGTHIYLWLTHVDVWQRPTQYCEAIFLQLKISLEKERGLLYRDPHFPDHLLGHSTVLSMAVV